MKLLIIASTRVIFGVKEAVVNVIKRLGVSGDFLSRLLAVMAL